MTSQLQRIDENEQQPVQYHKYLQQKVYQNLQYQRQQHQHQQHQQHQQQQQHQEHQQQKHQQQKHSREVMVLINSPSLVTKSPIKESVKLLRMYSKKSKFIMIC
jgi:hypothetical protein